MSPDRKRKYLVLNTEEAPAERNTFAGKRGVIIDEELDCFFEKYNRDLINHRWSQATGTYGKKRPSSAHSDNRRARKSPTKQ